jgi:hypothetical protein
MALVGGDGPPGDGLPDLGVFIKRRVCSTCQTTVQATPEDAARGYAVCPKCGASIEISAHPALNKNEQRALWLLSRVLRFTGRSPWDDLDRPVERPNDTKIELSSDPGQFFDAKIPPGGWAGGGAFMVVFTVFWCGFMVMWNAIGIVQRQWLMVGFGALHDAVGLLLIGLCLWRLFGRETIRAEYGRFTRTVELLGFTRERKVEWQAVERFYFGAAAKRNSRPSPGLYAAVGGRPIRLASNASTLELRWLRTELDRFFAPIWRR